MRWRNLYNSETGSPPVPPPPPDYKTQRTADGSYNDLEKPWMGMAGVRFGRNFLLEMRKVYASAIRNQLSTAAVVERCIIPPTQVVRQATQAGSTEAGKFTAGTLILLRLKKANAAAPGYDTAFMDGMWSACPARRWVPALFAKVWQQAIADNRP